MVCHGRQPQRRHPADPARRAGPAGARSCRASASTARTRDRRPRLRPQQVPAAATPAWDRLRDRPPPNRARLRARTCALGRRAHFRLAAQLQTTARPLRPPPRDPRSLPRNRLLPRLLQEARALIVIRLLSRGCPTPRFFLVTRARANTRSRRVLRGLREHGGQWSKQSSIGDHSNRGFSAPTCVTNAERRLLM